MDALASSGNWADLRKLRKGFSRQKGRLRTRDGVVVSSEEQAEILASYFEEVQWRVRVMDAVEIDENAEFIGEELPINLGPVSTDELKSAGKKLKRKKACGTDELPGELWRIILEDDTHVIFQWVLDFISSLWEGSQVPVQWHLSRVIALFRKGDLGDCSNCRPISLINVGFKLFDHILLSRLKDAGAEVKIWET